MALVVSDAHEGLIAAVLPGAAWQCCRTHFMRNLLYSHVTTMQREAAEKIGAALFD